MFVQPEHGTAQEKAADFVASVIKDVRLPVRMESLARVGMLEEMRAVKVRQPVRIRREVGWNPIQNDSDAALVHVVDQIHEILGCAKTRSGSKVTGGLVPPGSKKWVLHYRQKLDVGEVHALRVI